MPQAYAYQNSNFLSFLASSLQIGLFHPESTGERCGCGAQFRERTGIRATIRHVDAGTQHVRVEQYRNLLGRDRPVGHGAISSRTSSALTEDLLYWGALPGSGFLTAQAGATPTIPAGALLIDWTNPATGAAANWGPFTGFTPMANPESISIINQSGHGHRAGGDAEHDPSEGGRPCDAGIAQFLSMMPVRRWGSYLYFNVIDVTVPDFTAGFSIAGPTHLPFRRSEWQKATISTTGQAKSTMNFPIGICRRK